MIRDLLLPLRRQLRKLLPQPGHIVMGELPRVPIDDAKADRRLKYEVLAYLIAWFVALTLVLWLIGSITPGLSDFSLLLFEVASL